MDTIFTIEILESLIFSEDFVVANVHYHFDDLRARASTNTRKRGTYAEGGTLERSVRSVGRLRGMRAEGDDAREGQATLETTCGR